MYRNDLCKLANRHTDEYIMRMPKVYREVSIRHIRFYWRRCTMKNRILYWYNRVDNIRILQKELQLPTVNMTLDEHDLKDLLDILGTLKQIVEKGETE